jgi:inhibitor of KinA sporulation pathway (predicted exonuclease)
MNYIIFDLEATCWEKSNGKVSEIIEIGAVKLASNLEVISLFSEFVKPTINPLLSEFCKNLTSITQSDVDYASPFEEVMREFEKWIVLENNSARLFSWGHYDKKQILQECSVKGYKGSIISLLNEHCSLKHRFAEIKGIKLCGMSYALKSLGIELEGIHHRGIDDAKNITKIFKAVFNELNIQ